MNRQYTDWGYVDWLEPEMDSKKITLNVGIVSIAPHAHMNSHVHFTEQVIYTICGSGYSLINGEKIDMSEHNRILHWKAGVIHEMFNTSNTVFKHLMVSCPDKFVSNNPAISETHGLQLSKNESDELLRVVIEAFRNQFSGTLPYSLVYFDALGSVVARSAIFPKYCRSHCAQELLSNSADCMQKKLLQPSFDEDAFECRHGLTTLRVPIVFHDTLLGYVEGGFIHTKLCSSTDEEEVYVTPQSSIQGMQLLLRRIAQVMINYCEFYTFKKSLLERDLALDDKQHYQEILQADLQDAKNSMTNLQINNHFLFNTLNQMASMALESGTLPLYQSIVDLSKLFSFALRNNGNTVTLDKEIEYLQSYLKLQKIRYEDTLVVDFVMDDSLDQYVVPFNFMMPIVENAFIHGFKDVETKRLLISVQKQEDKLNLVVSNNGPVLDAEACRTMLDKMTHNSTHGLNMIYRKLKATFHDNFVVDITSDSQAGTKVHLMFLLDT